jgi:signal peptidase I
MEPLLQDGQLRWVLRAWCTGTPKRNEIWLIQGPEGPALKRVVGLPGETVEQKSGDLWVNGHPLK